ncbi:MULTISPECIES: endo-1,3-alpha-glucanase family glycosylhydrolase [unclassified Streptomyces]|uniref:endo-1,3-alpha-glucanase family glycosylhydrolase n=1 Tax=unclassified Streptomyces TaxID=2593676 RepID=UPI002E7FD835|nr:endo-1,3-alpha-glucanase family glycosylhydrolase [Streptomyces sp. NBC_00589]WTI34790.1 endo-1,3-alpha-glucanase family glycosylhydrolase [Streptomyces sp. NBC_00775]WUB31536.1 endo-1,3-alpha-glucanase family glycosylhydrolase [Streptomyces sp. NBC_00589]
MRRAALVVVLALVVAGLLPAPAPASEVRGGRAPLLAYYYQWFERSSWQRAKTDYPRLGRYSSDDASVIRTHIAWARSAGIDGFVVSWKSTAVNNRRLELLLAEARAQDFKVAVIYQGLDFHHRPLATARVAADFRLLRDRYARDPAFFRLGGKPLTVFSGTWGYATTDIARITGPVRSRLTVLGTEKNPEGCRRLARVTDGDAYYWSSVNPDTNDRHETKLRAMAGAVHGAGGYWMAPFAPGFDARKVGGTKSVPRDGGRTLRVEYAAAETSGPDVLGLISWNEFSENSHVEPSVEHGTQALDELRRLRGVPASAAPSVPPASSGSVRHQRLGYWPGLLRIAGCAALLVGAVAGLARLRSVRTRKERRT